MTSTADPTSKPMAVTSWPDLLAGLLQGRDLQPAETRWAMTEILSGNAASSQIAAFAVALRAKGETAEEIRGMVGAMLAAATPYDGLRPGRAVDTCGTGGDRANTANISTMAAFVVRGAGVPVVKHGNRAASSRCGSADLLEQLGVVIDLPAGGVARCLQEAGAAFCFAPVWHPALRHAASARREIGVPTAFNVLGPLTNPLQPPAQAVGVGEERLAPVVAGVLAARGTDALAFRGDDGLDELTTATSSRVWVVSKGEVRTEQIDPVDVGLSRSPVSELVGGDAARNAEIANAVLAGESGPIRDAVVLNAAAALVAASGPTRAPLADQLGEAVGEAAESIDSGAAAAALTRWAQASRRASGNDG